MRCRKAYLLLKGLLSILYIEMQKVWESVAVIAVISRFSFNSLFEMRVAGRPVCDVRKLDPLSILYLRCAGVVSLWPCCPRCIFQFSI